MLRNGSKKPECGTFTLINATLNTKCLIELINSPACGSDDTTEKLHTDI